MSNIPFLQRFVKGERWLFLFSIGCCVSGAAFEGLSYFFLIRAFNGLMEGKAFSQAICKALCFQLLKSGCCYLAAYLNATFAIRLQKNVQKKLYEKLFALPYSYFPGVKSGKVAEILRAPQAFFRLYFEHLNHFIVGSLLLFVGALFMLALSPLLTGVTFLLFFALYMVQKKNVKSSRTLSSALTRLLEKGGVDSEQTLSGIKLFHLFQFTGERVKKIFAPHERIERKTKDLILAGARVVALNEIGGIVCVSVILLVGYQLMTPAALLGFVTIAYRLSGKALGVVYAQHQMATLAGPCRQMEEFLGQEEEARGAEFLPFEKAIELDGLSFSYARRDQRVIDHLSLSIKKGEWIGIVGLSGAGKTTLLDLLAALYTPTSGQILIDGKKLEQRHALTWREKVGIVSQETFLFHESVEANIAFGSKNATLEQIRHAAMTAFAHAFITRLPQGYKTVVGERGHLLSGGERQRIALARALLRDPEILLLDEATSQLDVEAEQAIHEALLACREGKTIVMVAHRLSTLKSVDRILVLEKGRVVEEGSHNELVEKNGRYASLWQLQSGEK